MRKALETVGVAVVLVLTPTASAQHTDSVAPNCHIVDGRIFFPIEKHSIRVDGGHQVTYWGVAKQIRALKIKHGWLIGARPIYWTHIKGWAVWGVTTLNPATAKIFAVNTVAATATHLSTSPLRND